MSKYHRQFHTHYNHNSQMEMKDYKISVPTTKRLVEIWKKNKINYLELEFGLDESEIIDMDRYSPNNEYTYGHSYHEIDHGNFYDKDGHSKHLVKNITELRKFLKDCKDIKYLIYRYYNENIRTLVKCSTIMDDGELTEVKLIPQLDGIFDNETNTIKVTLSEDEKTFDIVFDSSEIVVIKTYEDVVDVTFSKNEVEFLKDKIKNFTGNFHIRPRFDCELNDCILKPGDKNKIRNIINTLNKKLSYNNFEKTIQKYICLQHNIKCNDNKLKHDTILGGNVEEKHYIDGDCNTHLNFVDSIDSDLGDGNLTFDGNKLKFKIICGYELHIPSWKLDYSKRNTTLEEKVNKILEKEKEYDKFDRMMDKRIQKYREKISKKLEQKKEEIDKLKSELLIF